MHTTTRCRYCVTTETTPLTADDCRTPGTIRTAWRAYCALKAKVGAADVQLLACLSDGRTIYRMDIESVSAFAAMRADT